MFVGRIKQKVLNRFSGLLTTVFSNICVNFSGNNLDLEVQVALIDE